jgi:hypothetical protein
VGVGGFDQHHIPACGSFPRPKCNGGSPAGCAVTVAVGGCCMLLSSSTSPCDVVGLTSLCLCVGESSRVSRLSRRSSVVWSRGA